jgi:glycosyl transferase, family 25
VVAAVIKKLDNIYVINVKKFVKRREFMQDQLAKFGIDAEFILDWDIDDLTTKIIDEYFAGDGVSPAQISCALKHVMVLQRIVDSGTQSNLILEDDAILAPEFAQGVQYALQEGADFSGLKVIFIGSGGNFYTPKSMRIPGQHLYPMHKGRFTDSYIIDAKTAKKRLDWIRQHKMTGPIDNQFDKMDRELGVKLLWLEDPVVEQGSKSGLFASSIEKALPNWLQAWTFFWEKMRRKYIYQLWR